MDERSPNTMVVTVHPLDFGVRLSWSGVDFTLRTTFGYTGHHWIPEKGTLENHVALQITPSEPQGVSWYMSVATAVRRLLTFMLGCAVYLLEIRPRFAAAPEGQDPVGFLYQGVTIPSALQTDIQFFSTRYGSIVGEVSGLVERWFRDADRLDVVVRAYADILTSTSAHPQAVFLNVIQVIEHFHGLLRPDDRRYLPRQEWNTVTDELQPHIVRAFEQLPGLTLADAAERAAALGGRIRSLNQVSIQTKLERLLEAMPPPALGSALGSRILTSTREDPEGRRALREFVGRVADTRHFLTHFDEEQRKRALSGIELERAVAACWGVLTYWLARELGLSEELAATMAHRATHGVFKTNLRDDEP